MPEVNEHARSIGLITFLNLYKKLSFGIKRRLGWDKASQNFLSKTNLGIALWIEGETIFREKKQHTHKEIGVFTKTVINSTTIGLKLIETTTGGTTHRINDILGDSHGRLKRLGIITQDIAIVDMKEVTVFSDHDIIQMSISDSQKIGDDTIGGR